MRWSIRTKILGVISGLLLLVIFAYLSIADRVFREDKQLLVFDMNRSEAETQANELEAYANRVMNKMELLSHLVLNTSPGKEPGFLREYLARDLDILLIQVYVVRQNKSELLREFFTEEKFKERAFSLRTFHSQEVQGMTPTMAPKEITLENRSHGKEILYLMRVPMRIKGSASRDAYFVQAIIDGKNWNTGLRNDTLTESFAVTADGTILAHPNSVLVTARKNLKEMPIVRAALTQNFLGEQMEFNFENQRYIGVYRKTDRANISVVAITNKEAALWASRLLLEKTFILSAIIITIVFLISLLFTGSLNKPLLQLVDATRSIAKGTFDAKLPIRSRDEIGTLAQAFEAMAKQLKGSRDQLEDYNRRLENKVQERTRELEKKNLAIREQQDALIQTTKLAAIGEVAGQAAHEVLNPLTGMIARINAMETRITGFFEAPQAPIPTYKAIVGAWKERFEEGGQKAWIAELSQLSKIKPGQTLAEEDLENLVQIDAQFQGFEKNLKDDLNLLHSEAQRIGRIVDSMRGLHRPPSVKATVDLCELITECVRATEELLSKNEIQVETAFWDQPHFVKCSRDEVLQVFSNLLKNSMDAILERKAKSPVPEPGLIRITVRTDGMWSRVAVWDNGMGIHPSAYEKIFQTHFSTKGEHGTGIGLTLSRRLVRETGGDLVLVASKYQEYTEFQMSFPRVVSSNEEPKAA